MAARLHRLTVSGGKTSSGQTKAAIWQSVRQIGTNRFVVRSVLYDTTPMQAVG
jgi:hypothetical protein